jgi:hypothetical protein
MNVKQRILALRLLEKQKKNQFNIKDLGLEIEIRSKDEKTNNQLSR